MLQDQFLQDRFLGKAPGSHAHTSADDNQHTVMPPAGARGALLMLVQRLWRFILLVKRRQELTRLAELDDHLLADIGITRSDLAVAGREPLLRDPTKLLAQRARDRWHGW
jgi:uncharacterized protein YjiS (DUF1127 family)